MNLISLLLNLVKPLIGKVLAALGMSIVSYTGMQYVLEGLNSRIQTELDGMPVVAASLAGMAGLGDCFGIIVGAFAFRLSMSTFKRLEFNK